MKIQNKYQEAAIWGSLALVVAQLFWFHSVIFGFISFAVYLYAATPLWMAVMKKVFGMKAPPLALAGISIAWQIIFIGLLLAPWVAWYILPSWTIVLSMGFSAGLGMYLSRWSQRRGKRTDKSFVQVHVEKRLFWKLPFLVYLIYIIGAAALFFLLWRLGNTGIALQPWQLLPQWYGYAFFALTALWGLLLFSKSKTSALLFIIVVQSVLVHFITPFSHEIPYGGDVWRNIAVQQTIIDEEPVLPVLFGEEKTSRDVFGYEVPDALLVPQKYVYAHFWATTSWIGKLIPVSLVQLNRYLMPILWGSLFPLILYILGRRLFESKRYSIWLAAASVILFSWYALGSLTLAASLGMMTFLVFFTLYTHALVRKNKNIVRGVILAAVLMLFSYPVHAIIFWTLIMASPVIRGLKKISKKKTKEVKVWVWLFAVVGSALTALIIPVLELVSRTSRFPQVFDPNTLRQFVGQVSGITFASAIRPHDILAMNILFNHTPQAAFVSTIFTQWRWHLAGVSIIVLALAVYAFWKLIKKERAHKWVMVLLIGVMTLPTYVFGWYVLEGDKSFIRRLDGVVAFVVLLLVFYACALCSTKYAKIFRHNIQGRVIALLIIFGLSFTSVSIWQSGPDMRVVTGQEYTLAQQISEKNYQCVLADTWPLLALEGLTKGKSVGGGFPIDGQFAQPERIEVLAQLRENPSEAIQSTVELFPNTILCIFALSFEQDNGSTFEKVVAVLGQPTLDVGSFALWEVPLKNNL